MSSSDVDVLEARISNLEKKIFGLNRVPSAQDKLPESNVIENLSYANTLITAALSGRDKFNTLAQKLQEIDICYTDVEPTCLQTDAKREYILAMEPEIRQNFRQLKQLQELLPVLNSDRFNNIPELSKTLQNLTLEYSKHSQEADLVNTATRTAISKYNEIITNMSIVLIKLDEEVTQLEKAAEFKKIVD